MENIKDVENDITVTKNHLYKSIFTHRKSHSTITISQTSSENIFVSGETLLEIRKSSKY